MVTVRSFATAKVAVVARAIVIDTRHVLLGPVQDPDQPMKTEPVAGVAVSVTDVP